MLYWALGLGGGTTDLTKHSLVRVRGWMKSLRTHRKKVMGGASCPKFDWVGDFRILVIAGRSSLQECQH